MLGYQTTARSRDAVLCLFRATRCGNTFLGTFQDVAEPWQNRTETKAAVPRKLTKYDLKRLKRRNTLWPDAADVIYNRKDEFGFITVPRTLAMIGTLIKHLGETVDPSRVYWELWSRQRDDGFVEIDDPDEFAQAAGFHRGTTRRVRSLREGLDRLAELGFIRLAGKGQRKHAFVLVLHPHDVVQQIRHEHATRIPDWWWELFQLRAGDIGAVLRWKPAPPAKAATIGAAESLDAFPDALEGEDDDLPF